MTLRTFRLLGVDADLKRAPKGSPGPFAFRLLAAEGLRAAAPLTGVAALVFAAGAFARRLLAASGAAALSFTGTGTARRRLRAGGSAAAVVVSSPAQALRRRLAGGAAAITLAGSAAAEVSGGGYDADAEAAFAAMTVQPDATRKSQYNSFIVAVKAAGVWPKLDAVHLLAAHDQQAARVNLKAPASFLASKVNEPAFTVDRGYAGDGSSSYLDTGFNPSTAGGNFGQDDAFFAVWNRTAGTSSASSAGWYDGADGVTIAPHNAAGQATGRINQASSIAATVPSAVGLISVGRSSSSSIEIRKNGVFLTSASNASTPLVNGTLRLGSITASSFSNREHAACVIAGHLTADEDLALYNALSAYLTSVGA